MRKEKILSSIIKVNDKIPRYDYDRKTNINYY